VRFSDEAVLRLVVAILLGAIVGAEREARDQQAGLRTHIAVCLGAAIFGVISTLGFEEFEARRGTTNVNIDVTRVASQVVVGIGFLGAGVIFREREVVKNLTTAASMWVTSAIGLMAGVGDLGTAAAATVLLVAVLVLLMPLRTFLRRSVRRPSEEVSMRLHPDASVDAVLAGIDALEGVDADRVRLTKVSNRTVVTVRLRAAAGVDLDTQIRPLALRDDIEELGTTAEVHD
jgi:putative Mg2+ transporter-C (MgtC) family protein